MDSQQTAVNSLEEVIDSIESLDLSFLLGEAKGDAEYSLNEVIIDLQHIRTIFDAGQN